MNAQPQFARCHCPECVKLDKLPVRRHGIPHAYQPSLLSGGDYVPLPQELVHPPVGVSLAPPVDDLPLFGGLDAVLL